MSNNCLLKSPSVDLIRILSLCFIMCQKGTLKGSLKFFATVILDVQRRSKQQNVKHRLLSIYFAVLKTKDLLNNRKKKKKVFRLLHKNSKFNRNIDAQDEVRCTEPLRT